MEKYILKNQKQLRCGITTGTCSAAAAGAAAKLLMLNIESNEVNIHTPKGAKVSVPVILKRKTDKKAEYMVIKDSGDDPDVTNNAEICVSVEIIDNKEVSTFAFRDERYENLYLDGGIGVGRVTKAGLEQNIGQAAINSVPRDMIFKAVGEVCQLAECRERLLITVNIPKGEELAERTFNPRLGIEGGISVLGTSGILEPMSEKAIIDTIETEIRQLHVQGNENLLVTPGNYGKSYVSDYLHLDLNKSIKCSNYIGETLDLAVSYKMKNFLLVGNIGKLCKLAAGIMNTHSKVADGRCEIMALHTVLCGGSMETAEKIMKCINTEKILDILEVCSLRNVVIESICSKIYEHIRHRVGNNMDFGVMLFSEKYGFLGQTKGTEIILNKYR